MLCHWLVGKVGSLGLLDVAPLARGRFLRNLDVVRGRNLELEHFLSQQGVDICLLNDTFLNAAQDFQLANYVCHRTERPTAGVAQPSWSAMVKSTTLCRFRA